MKIKSYTELFIFIVTAELVGVLSALLTGDFSGFFDKNLQSPLMPPAWVFSVVWVILYALMGISAYLVYSSDGGSQYPISSVGVFCCLSEHCSCRYK